MLERAAGGADRTRATSSTRAPPARSASARPISPTRPAVVVATERMDEDPGWRALESGELLHVDAESLNVTSRRLVTEPPAHPLTLADLGARRRLAGTDPRS